MSESELTKALRKAVEFDESQEIWLQFNDSIRADAINGAQQENARLKPLWDKVISVVEAADETMWTNTHRKTPLGIALEQLRLAVGEK